MGASEIGPSPSQVDAGMPPPVASQGDLLAKVVKVSL